MLEWEDEIRIYASNPRESEKCQNQYYRIMSQEIFKNHRDINYRVLRGCFD